jgi:hypothetical protein
MWAENHDRHDGGQDDDVRDEREPVSRQFRQFIASWGVDGLV